MFDKKFIGMKKVKGVEVIDSYKTYLGNDVLMVTFVDGSEEMMTKKSYDLLVTSKLNDLTNLRNTKIKEMEKEVLNIIFEYDITSDEFEYLMHSVKESLVEGYNRALYVKLHGNDNGYTPGSPIVGSISMLLMDKILKDKYKEDAE